MFVSGVIMSTTTVEDNIVSRKFLQNDPAISITSLKIDSSMVVVSWPVSGVMMLTRHDRASFPASGKMIVG